MHLFSSYFSTFFPFFSLFLPFSVITPSIYIFLTIGMGVRCCVRAIVLRTSKVLRTLKV